MVIAFTSRVSELTFIPNRVQSGIGSRITTGRFFNRLGANYQGDGPGILRKIPEEAMEEIRKIFEVTGGTRRYEKIEFYSKKKS